MDSRIDSDALLGAEYIFPEDTLVRLAKNSSLCVLIYPDHSVVNFTVTLCRKTKGITVTPERNEQPIGDKS